MEFDYPFRSGGLLLGTSASRNLPPESYKDSLSTQHIPAVVTRYLIGFLECYYISFGVQHSHLMMSEATNVVHSLQSRRESSLQHHLQLNGLELSEEGVIRWKPNTPHHPRNWKLGRKLYDTSLIMFLDFFT